MGSIFFKSIDINLPLLAALIAYCDQLPGAAPGSWSQYAFKAAKSGKLISVDLKEMEPIGNSVQIQGDFTEEKTQ